MIDIDKLKEDILYIGIQDKNQEEWILEHIDKLVEEYKASNLVPTTNKSLVPQKVVQNDSQEQEKCRCAQTPMGSAELSPDTKAYANAYKKLTGKNKSKCCKSTFNIYYKDDVEGEYYNCDKCLGDCDLVRIKNHNKKQMPKGFEDQNYEEDEEIYKNHIEGSDIKPRDLMRELNGGNSSSKGDKTEPSDTKGCNHPWQDARLDCPYCNPKASDKNKIPYDWDVHWNQHEGSDKKEEIDWLQSILDSKHINKDNKWIIEGRISKLKTTHKKKCPYCSMIGFTCDICKDKIKKCENVCKCGHDKHFHYAKENGVLMMDLHRASKGDYNYGCDVKNCNCNKFEGSKNITKVLES